MATYVLLVKLSDKGAADVRNVSQRLEQSVKAWAEVGGGSLDILMTMGDWDYCCIGDAPNDEAVMKFLYKLAAHGNVHTCTMKAFRKDQIAEMLTGV